MECKLYTAQKVVCIADDVDWFRIPGVIYPELDHVYEIRAVCKGKGVHTNKPFVGVKLVELVNPLVDLGNGRPEEPTFDYRAFRPVYTGKTDISIFQPLLNPAMPVVTAVNALDQGAAVKKVKSG